MALVTAYLARTAQRNAGRSSASAARSFLSRVRNIVRATSMALSEAQELRRIMTQKYPFTDI